MVYSILEKIKQNFKLKNFIIGFIVVLLPFICASFLLIVNGYGLNFSILMPTVSDEFSWYSQIDSMAKFGMPQGFWGYNGTHALKGTFGPWGLAPLIPYAVFAKIFGWELYSMPIANMTFLSVALLTFLILTKPDNKQKLLIILTYCCMNIVIGYSIMSMSEGLRYSCAIVLAGILVWLDRKSREEKHGVRTWISYAVIGLLTFFFINVYLILALVVPLYCWLMLRKKHIALRIAVSIAVTLVFAVSANYLVSLVSSPYGSSTLENILETIKTEGIYTGICYAINNSFQNLYTLNFQKIITGNTILFWFFSLFLSILVVVGYELLKRKQQVLSEADGFLKISGLYLPLGFLAGYCVLYTGSDWTLCRGITTGLLMCLLILIFTDICSDKKVLTVISLLSIMNTWFQFHNGLASMAQTSQYSEKIIAEREKLEELMPLSDNRWDNTIATYGKSGTEGLAMPSGYGSIYMMNQAPNEKAKYALYIASDTNRDFYDELLLSSGHTLFLEDEFFVIYIRNQ